MIEGLSRLFDPLGWAALCLVTVEVMIQKLWLSGIDWDDELPSNLLKEWLKYRENLIQMKDFTVPRWIRMKIGDEVKLHRFCDASNLAYGTVVYTRAINPNGEIRDFDCCYNKSSTNNANIHTSARADRSSHTCTVNFKCG